LIEENVFYKPIQKGRHLYLSPADGINPTIAHSLTEVIVIGNIFFECAGAAAGTHMRGGGDLINNLIVKNDLWQMGGSGGSEDSIQSGNVINNVFLESADATTTVDSLQLINIDGAEVANNIWTDHSATTSGGSNAISLKGNVAVFIARNQDIHDNIVYGWGQVGTSRRAFQVAPLTEKVNVQVRDNDFQMVAGASNIVRHYGDFIGVTYNGNKYFSSDAASTWFSQGGTVTGWAGLSGEEGYQTSKILYPYPDRNLKTYNQQLGGTPSTEDFMLSAIKQSRDNWRNEYTACAANNYIRTGFGKETLNCLFQ
jgi:hypothetical protein